MGVPLYMCETDTDVSAIDGTHSCMVFISLL
jgi:hypothetical protein